jgi:hypothetical protein
MKITIQGRLLTLRRYRFGFNPLLLITLLGIELGYPEKSVQLGTGLITPGK